MVLSNQREKKMCTFCLVCVTIINICCFFLAKWIFFCVCCLLLRMVISPHFPKHTSMNNYKVSMMAHLKIIMCSSKQEPTTIHKKIMLITFYFKKSVNVWHGKWLWYDIKRDKRRICFKHKHMKTCTNLFVCSVKSLLKT